MRKLFPLFIFMLCVILCSTYAFAYEPADFAEGEGTADSPYKITTATELDSVRKHPDAYFVLAEDIVFNESDFAEGGEFYNDGAFWTPIGDAESPFTGNFNGGGHKIKGLKINMNVSTGAYAGLFGVVDSGTVTNLGMRSCNITLNGQAEADEWVCLYAGSIAGLLRGGTIENCFNTGNVSVSSAVSLNRVGGIVGGMDENSSVKTSYNSGNISASSTENVSTAGGIAGDVNHGKISDCYNSGSVSASARNETYAFCGGIAGEISTLDDSSPSSITVCYNSGTITTFSASTKDTQQAEATASGIVSSCLYSTVGNCYSIDTVSTCVGYSSGSYPSAQILSSDKMRDQSYYSSFDFTNTWQMGNGSAYLYPTLKNVPHDNVKIESIEVSKHPDKINYYENDELDLTGGELTLIYDDGSTEIIDLGNAIVSGFTSSEVGEIELTVTYSDLTTVFSIIIDHEYYNDFVQADCDTDGGEYIKCRQCDYVYVDPSTVEPALGHARKTVDGYEATCTEDGMTDGSECSVCGEILVEQEEIPALGHTEEDIPEKEATCTEAGSTGGTQCSVCGDIVVEATEVKKLGHSFSELEFQDEGYYLKHCNTCGLDEMAGSEETIDKINAEMELLSLSGLTPDDEDIVNELIKVCGGLSADEKAQITKYSELTEMYERFELHNNGDIDFDGIIRSTDLSILLFHYDQDTDLSFDLTDDGIVNYLDLSKLLTNYGNRA